MIDQASKSLLLMGEAGEGRGKDPPAVRMGEGAVNALAGATSGLVGGIIVCPLDVIKTKLQVQGTFRRVKPEAPYHRGIVGMAKAILREDGLRGMYRGLTPLIVGYLPSWTCYFWVYKEMQGILGKATPVATVFSATVAGATSTVLTAPIWMVKTRLMAQSSQTSWHYSSMIDACRQIYTKEGIGMFYSGLGSSLLGLPHVAIQFPLYESLKTWFTPKSDGLDARSTLGFLAASILSKIVASTVTYPHEVIRSRNQIRAQDPRYRGVLATAKLLYVEEGWRVFYAGLGTNICRAVPSSAITLVTFEIVSRLLHRRYLTGGVDDATERSEDDPVLGTGSEEPYV